MTTAIQEAGAPKGWESSIGGSAAWSAADYALAAFIDILRVSNLPVGSRLPNLPDIAGAVRVSHVVAREALSVLENEDIIVVKQGRNGGLFVAGYAGYPKCLMRLYPYSTQEDLPALLQARRILEREVSLLAGACMTEAARETLGGLVSAMREATDNPDLFIELTVRFHMHVALIAGNPLLLNYVRDVLNRMAVAGIATRIESLTVGGIDRAAKVYEEVLTAVATGDESHIVVAVDQHIDAVLRMMGLGEPAVAVD